MICASCCAVGRRTSGSVVGEAGRGGVTGHAARLERTYRARDAVLRRRLFIPHDCGERLHGIRLRGFKGRLHLRVERLAATGVAALSWPEAGRRSAHGPANALFSGLECVDPNHAASACSGSGRWPRASRNGPGPSSSSACTTRLISWRSSSETEMPSLDATRPLFRPLSCEHAHPAGRHVSSERPKAL